MEPSIPDLLASASSLASQAVIADQREDAYDASQLYLEAYKCLQRVLAANRDYEAEYARTAHSYLTRAQELRAIVADRRSNRRSESVSRQDGIEQRCLFMLQDAIGLEEKGQTDEALEMYLNAAEMCLEARKTAANSKSQAQLAKLAREAMSRAETLKTSKALENLKLPDIPNTPLLEASSPPPPPSHPPRLSSPHPGPSVGVSSGSGRPAHREGGLTVEERGVLKTTSRINGKVFPPFLETDLKERFAYMDMFEDQDGKLLLAPKQKKNFDKWIRPSDVCSDPKMIVAISSDSIRQTVVSDCSFVASLAITASFERKFKKQLITKCLYPQDRHGRPVYNPSGKYMVKLWLNGVHRKIIVDDFLPLNKYGELMCSYSQNPNEFWVSILEKAYMKVMGGYDFPGSNSNIDLYALTGWIPERVRIKLGSKDFNAETQFRRMEDGLRTGDILITAATGEINDADAERTGLVSTHAYAVLDVRRVQDKMMIQLKNPWSHLRWKGRFSENDTQSWTPALRKALNYDRNRALETDNGVFWMDWDTLCHFYDVVYMNWDPKLFSHKTLRHATWPKPTGAEAIKDAYSLGKNPQYRLEVKNADQHAAVWILLSRHITNRQDFAENEEYITVHVFRQDGKVYFLENPEHQGTKINSPHYLVKLNKIPMGLTHYTLVVAQFEMVHTIHYTLTVFSTMPAKLTPISDPYKHHDRVKGEWTRETAGGCPNYPATHSKNPSFQINLLGKDPCQLRIELRAPKEYSVGFQVIPILSTPTDPSIGKTSSGAYRYGYTVLEKGNVPPCIFNIIPSTFEPGQIGPFFLDIDSTQRFKLAPLN
ncbi:calpain-7-like [Oscarella lobularis]|uniref:calpain-7-like n=1 Tax=Oscarella lobularis TaxID=121494 RepID=UPI003313C551